MTRLPRLLRSRVAGPAIAAVALAAIAAGLYAFSSPAGRSDIETVEIVKGTFVDRLDVRGEIRPVRSVVLTAPMGSGELQIVTLVRSGTAVNEGDVVVRFDGTTQQRAIEDREVELRQAEAEIDRARARAATTEEQNQTALLTARFDVDRARLDLSNEALLARMDAARGRLALADAEQRLREMEQKVAADRAAAEADIASRRRQRDKVADDFTRARRALTSLEIRAPAAGTIHTLLNPRAGGPMGGGPPQEFREGDRAWPGAPVVELPDLSEILLVAQIEEGDRGRLDAGRRADVRVDAIPDRDLKAVVADISVLARVNFASGFPPPRNFQLTVRIEDEEPRLRPGMSATARIEIDRLDDVLLVPATAVFAAAGRPVLYRRAGSLFERVPVEIARRSREQVVITSGARAGEHIATSEPPQDLVREAG